MTRDELRLMHFKGKDIRNDEYTLENYILDLEDIIIINETQQELDKHFAKKGIN
jgi:hypothetical protein